jgi:hypothetical protein
MNRFWLRCLCFVLLLAPSAQFAWRNRDLPRLGLLSDDGILFSSARSLASGAGYRIASLPEQPYQTKYPPLYPLYLSLIWKLNPRFPENVPIATFVNWFLMVPFLALSWALYRRLELSVSRKAALLALLALSPYLILFGTSLLSELFFTCWVLATVLVAGRSGLRMAFFAGILAGCAYLSRTAGIVLAFAVPASYLMREEGRRSVRSALSSMLSFWVGMLPFVAGWTFWTQTHRFPTNDLGILYHTDYLGYQFLNVGWNNLAAVVQMNVGELIQGMGFLVLPHLFDSLVERAAAGVLALGMVVGLIHWIRNPIARPYALFSIGMMALLIFWHFPPNERFVLPLFPMLLLGLMGEWERLSGMLRLSLQSGSTAHRFIAWGWLCAAGLVAAGIVFLNAYGTFGFLPRLMERDRGHLVERQRAYTWMSTNLSVSAQVLSAEDSLLYLYTGFRGNSIPLLPRDWYAQEPSMFVDAYRNIAPYCRSRGIGYIYSTSEELSRWGRPEEALPAIQSLLDNPELQRIYSDAYGNVFRVLPIPAAGSRKP